ncbi:MAG: O-methyltransferase [Bacteroidota bacterium]|nr:O-methyltransferase [Candidatus Kapabacteria bacterium]MDW8220679.1 O-methyltransferase [Bacteroidota bacterium]
MKHVPLTEALHQYICTTFPAEDALLQRIKQEAEQAGLPAIHIAPEQGALLQVLLRAIGARRVLEIGTLVGYSAIMMARALPPDGYLLTLESDEHHADYARVNIRAASLDHIIEVRVGRAQDILHSISGAVFDAVFIDADKAGYTTYLEHSVRLVRVGGLIIADNTLAWGKIADTTTDDPTIQALQQFNKALKAHPMLHSCLVPIAEGMTISVRL